MTLGAMGHRPLAPGLFATVTIEAPIHGQRGHLVHDRHLVDRGLKGVQLVISDACRGLVESIADFLPEARYQRCMVHFYRNVFSHVPSTRVREVSHMLRAIHAPGEP